jgi:hypothetical protein
MSEKSNLRTARSVFEDDSTMMLDAARYQYWKSVRSFLRSAERSAERYERAIGELNAEQAFDGWIHTLADTLTMHADGE